MNDNLNDPQLPASQPEKAAASTQAAPQAVNWERSTLEKLATNYLLEQKTARRWRTFVRLAWLTFFALLAWSALDRGNSSKDTNADHTAVVEIKGEISSGGEAVQTKFWSPCAALLKTKAQKQWSCSSTLQAAARCRRA